MHRLSLLLPGSQNICGGFHREAESKKQVLKQCGETGRDMDKISEIKVQRADGRTAGESKEVQGAYMIKTFRRAEPRGTYHQ